MAPAEPPGKGAVGAPGTALVSSALSLLVAHAGAQRDHVVDLERDGGVDVQRLDLGPDGVELATHRVVPHSVASPKGALTAGPTDHCGLIIQVP